MRPASNTSFQPNPIRRLSAKVPAKYSRLGSVVDSRPRSSTTTSNLPQQTGPIGRSFLNNIPTPPQNLEESLSTRFVGTPPCPVEKPMQPCITVAEVKIIPELENITVEESRTMWVAVELTGIIGPANGMDANHGLDVVVIVDDS